MILEQITGTGMEFPFTITSGKVTPVSGLELIRSCIKNILMFDYGTRYFQRDFGVGLEKYLGEPNDLITESMISHKLSTQLVKWDKRITITSLKVKRDEMGNMIIDLELALTGTDQRQQITFPINSTYWYLYGFYG